MSPVNKNKFFISFDIKLLFNLIFVNALFMSLSREVSQKPSRYFKLNNYIIKLECLLLTFPYLTSLVNGQEREFLRIRRVSE